LPHKAASASAAIVSVAGPRPDGELVVAMVVVAVAAAMPAMALVAAILHRQKFPGLRHSSFLA